MISEVNVAEYREPGEDIMPALWRRWSPRIMSGKAVAAKDLARLFEAARWAPSSYNRQPWRYVYAASDSNHWQGFFDLLVEGNQRWCKNAGALIVVAAKTTDDKGEATRTHTFDVGASWQNIALQGCHMGLVIYAMQGFDYDRAHALAGFTNEHKVEAMIAVGHPGSLEGASEKVRGREQPSNRNAITTFAFEGKYSGR